MGCIRLTMPPPVVIMEVVSPGEVQRNRDCVAKRMQYDDLGVPEYWIIDPQEATIQVLELVDGVYAEAATFRDDDAIESPQFGQIELTVADVVAIPSDEGVSAGANR